MSGSRVIAPDICLAVSHSCPVGDKQAARPESKLWWSGAALPSLRVPPVGQQRHCHTVRGMVRFLQPSISGKVHRGARQKPSVATIRGLEMHHPIVHWL